jgi:hypothetical protein
MQQDSGYTAEREGGSEDTEREIWFEQIALASLKAADRLLSIQQVCLPAAPPANHVSSLTFLRCRMPSNCMCKICLLPLESHGVFLCACACLARHSTRLYTPGVPMP